MQVFRTDSSYSRWDEALSAFGAVKSACTELLRYRDVFSDAGLQDMYRRWAIVFCRSLKVHVTQVGYLRGEGGSSVGRGASASAVNSRSCVSHACGRVLCLCVIHAIHVLICGPDHVIHVLICMRPRSCDSYACGLDPACHMHAAKVLSAAA